MASRLLLDAVRLLAVSKRLYNDDAILDISKLLK